MLQILFFFGPVRLLHGTPMLQSGIPYFARSATSASTLSAHSGRQINRSAK
jgi:hypothetical protein